MFGILDFEELGKQAPFGHKVVVSGTWHGHSDWFWVPSLEHANRCRVSKLDFQNDLYDRREMNLENEDLFCKSLHLHKQSQQPTCVL